MALADRWPFRERSQVEDPRRVVSGTSLNASGTIEVPASSFTEQGSAKSGRLIDVVPALASRGQALRVYEEMSNGDATVDISLRAAKIPVLGADFFMQPFDAKPLNQEIAEFAGFNIFEGMTHSFIQALEESLRMFDYGFSILEPVWETREWAPRRTGANRRKYTMIRKLAPRPAPTIQEFQYDDEGGPVGLIQRALREKGKVEKVEIGIEKLVIFTNNKKGGDLEGKSLLRTAYQPWYYKKELYKIDAIQKERHALGVPVINIENPGYSKKDVEVALAMVQNIRTNEHLGGVLPPGFDLSFKEPGGAPIEIMPSIDHHDRQILLNVMAQFLLLGLQSGGGGGRATSASHVDMFQKSLRYVGANICDAFNLYLIPKLVGYNFDTTEFPTMQVRNIGEAKDIQMLSSAWSNLVSTEAVTMDDETENYIRRTVLDAPPRMTPRPEPVEKPEGQRGTVDPESRRSGTGNRNTEPGFEEDG